MRLVVTGRQGQVVRSLIERADAKDVEVIPVGRPSLDLSVDTEAIERTITDAKPDVVLSAAAYTLVDKAEMEPDRAFAVNERGARHVARAAANLSVPLIHMSTDYVFDGAKDAPYVEDDPTAPGGVYGASKLAGEIAVMEEHRDAVVLRTAWVYSPFGSNFVRTMLRLAADREEVGVVADQFGNPTSALDIAEGILVIAGNLCGRREVELRGIFHMAARGEASWAMLAEAIFAISQEWGGPTADVKYLSTADYPTAAKRPHNSRLDSKKLEVLHGVQLPDWRLALPPIVSRIVQGNSWGA